MKDQVQRSSKRSPIRMAILDQAMRWNAREVELPPPNHSFAHRPLRHPRFSKLRVLRSRG